MVLCKFFFSFCVSFSLPAISSLAAAKLRVSSSTSALYACTSAAVLFLSNTPFCAPSDSWAVGSPSLPFPSKACAFIRHQSLSAAASLPSSLARSASCSNTARSAAAARSIATPSLPAPAMVPSMAALAALSALSSDLRDSILSAATLSLDSASTTFAEASASTSSREESTAASTWDAISPLRDASVASRLRMVMSWFFR
mmetsp:Transcript_5782/g.12232  ORF Transcript_5782/g.12232 Transcript_5782/m.12232 type:complete len:200 (-) Transcript_5782:671-1270(-)